MAKVNKNAIKRRLEKKNPDASKKKKRDMAKGNSKGWLGLRNS